VSVFGILSVVLVVGMLFVKRIGIKLKLIVNMCVVFMQVFLFLMIAFPFTEAIRWVNC
jgi:hypothetical protein